MIIEIPTTLSVDIRQIVIIAPVRYDEEDTPNNFPGRTGDVVNWVIDIETSRIVNFSWPTPTELYMKVVDGGTYSIVDDDGQERARIEGDYVPSGLGEYGDYLAFTIEPDGRIHGSNLDLAAAVEAIASRLDDN